MYLFIKTLHLSCVALSYALFVWRGALRLRGQTLPRWLRVVPHLVDTVLLLSALILTTLIGQYPFVHGWLTAKVLALLCYIVVLHRAGVLEFQPCPHPPCAVVGLVSRPIGFCLHCVDGYPASPFIFLGIEYADHKCNARCRYF